MAGREGLSLSCPVLLRTLNCAKTYGSISKKEEMIVKCLAICFYCYFTIQKIYFCIISSSFRVQTGLYDLGGSYS